MTVFALSLLAPKQARDSFDRYSDEIEPSLLDDMRLMTSEMVSNSVLHSGRPEGDPIDVETTVRPEMIRVQVTDQGHGVEPLRARSQMPPSGLRYLDLLSDRWSSRIVNPFQVWFEIDIHPTSLLRRKNTLLADSSNGDEPARP